ncbi:MAG: hypothetical protein F2923_02650 [Actinobacteria bacterium]|uniref:Unannotated protein n=1 Tax=freshwater metagenome TaxID=449393 RepID=A0A6J7S7A0_9ZZZZ|nr:hypothetical protein [Actinomycetota bacterium]
MAKNFRQMAGISASTAGIILLVTGLSGCSSTESAPAPEISPAASQSRDASIWGTRNVRICVSGTASTTIEIDLGPIKGSKGAEYTLDEKNHGPACYTSDNIGFAGTAGVNVLFEEQNLILYGQNLALQRPDLLLCARTSDPLINSVNCDSSVLMKQTFSQGETKPLNGGGHKFEATRENDTGDYIEFKVTFIK